MSYFWVAYLYKTQFIKFRKYLLDWIKIHNNRNISQCFSLHISSSLISLLLFFFTMPLKKLNNLKRFFPKSGPQIMSHKNTSRHITSLEAKQLHLTHHIFTAHSNKHLTHHHCWRQSLISQACTHNYTTKQVIDCYNSSTLKNLDETH